MEPTLLNWYETIDYNGSNSIFSLKPSQAENSFLQSHSSLTHLLHSLILNFPWATSPTILDLHTHLDQIQLPLVSLCSLDHLPIQ
jgi:hypothetical protein